MPLQPHQSPRCSMDMQAHSSPRAFAPYVPVAKNTPASPLCASAFSSGTWDTSRSGLTGLLERCVETIHTKLQEQAFSCWVPIHGLGRWLEVGTDGLGSQHQGPVGQPAGYQGSALSLAGNLGSNPHSWEETVPGKPSISCLTATGLPPWAPAPCSASPNEVASHQASLDASAQPPAREGRAAKPHARVPAHLLAERGRGRGQGGSSVASLHPGL